MTFNTSNYHNMLPGIMTHLLLRIFFFLPLFKIYSPDNSYKKSQTGITNATFFPPPNTLSFKMKELIEYLVI